jgi:hypothetical protein
MADGLTVPLAAGLSAAVSNTSVIVTAGLSAERIVFAASADRAFLKSTRLMRRFFPDLLGLSARSLFSDEDLSHLPAIATLAKQQNPAPKFGLPRSMRSRRRLS